MPAALRVLLVLLAVLAMTAGSVLLTLGANLDDAALALACVLLGTAVVAPLAAVAPAIAWRGAVRPLLLRAAMLLALQVAAVGGLCVVLAAHRAAPLAVGAVAGGAALLDVASLAVARSLRRSDARLRPVPVADVRVPPVGRGPLVGATLGLVGAGGIAVLVGGSVAGSDPLLMILLLLAAAGLGGDLGLLPARLRVARGIRGLLQGDPETARRIGLALRGDPARLSEEQQDRTARYAVLALRRDRLALAGRLLMLVPVAVAIPVVVLHGGSPVMAVLVGLSIAFGLLSTGLRAPGGRRLRAYVAAHPVPEGAAAQ